MMPVLNDISRRVCDVTESNSRSAAAAGTLTIIPGAFVIYFVRNYIAKGFALGRV